MADSPSIAIRQCETCDSYNVPCQFFESVRLASGRVGERWMCVICANTIFGVLLVRESAQGGFHIDPVLVKGIVQSLHVVAKMMKGEL